MDAKRPETSILIPSIDGSRDGMLPRLLEQLKSQTYQDFEVIIKVGDNRQGRAINNAAGEAKGDYIVIMDDDIFLGHDTLLERLVAAVRSEPKIGMGGASVVVWDKANWLQRRVMIEVPRYAAPVVSEITDSDLAFHGCCILRKDVFFAVGGERENIIRGLDPDLRMRLRGAGYRVALIPHTWFYHLPPATFGKFVKKFFRNGQGSSYIQLMHPEFIYETHTGEGEFVERRGLAYRIFRYPLRLAGHLIHGRLIGFTADCAYAAGVLTGYVKYGWQKRARARAASSGRE
ncbi:MAG TPA: glycosyltransferase family 2 protein [bacterium]|nr:glycosyltransferase family 2 protein [bacterium]